MPLPRLIPCLDVANGRVVKGVSFVGLRDVGDPVELATFYSAGGADELVFLDIAATPDDTQTMTSVVADVADVLEIPFTVGGGVRSVEDATRIIEAGADRVSLNSAALADPSLIGAIAERYGSQAVVVAIDAGDGVVRVQPDGGPCVQRGTTVLHASCHCDRLRRRHCVGADADEPVDAGRAGALENHRKVVLTGALAGSPQVLLLHMAVGVEPTAHPLRRGKRGSPFTTAAPPG